MAEAARLAGPALALSLIPGSSFVLVEPGSAGHRERGGLVCTAGREHRGRSRLPWHPGARDTTPLPSALPSTDRLWCPNRFTLGSGGSSRVTAVRRGVSDRRLPVGEATLRTASGV